MANNSEKLSQELTKNYSNVQKKELDYVDFRTSVDKSFASNTKTLESKLKKALSEIATEDKDIIKSFKQQLKDLTDQNKNFNTELKAKRKHETEKSDKALSELDEKFNIEETKIDESLSKINDLYASNLSKDEKEYNTNIDRSMKQKDDVVNKTEKDIENLDEKYEKEKVKVDEKIKSLNEKKDEKTEKTKKASETKVAKINSNLEAEEKKTNKWKEERHPVYLEGLEKIEEEIQEEAKNYEDKYTAIKSTMESRVARREKFVNRAQSEGDSKAVKAQNKEIKKIKNDAEKELKIIQKKHNEESSELADKRKKYMQSYLNEIADFDKKYIKYCEELKNQLVELDIELYKDIAEIDIDFRTKINNETKKLNDFYEEVETKKANLLDEKNRKLLKLDNDIEDFGIRNVESKAIAAFENEKQKALHDKQHTINSIELEKDKELEKIELEKILAKFDLDDKTKNEKFEVDKLILVEEEVIEHHEKTFSSQTVISNEFKEFQDEFTTLYTSRATALSEYEELETTNRYKLRVSFMQKQLEIVTKDADKALSKVNKRFDEEVKDYNTLIEAGTKGELEDLLQYEQEKQAEIDKEIEKRNTLNPRAYKKQIRDLDQKIDQMKRQLSQDVDERKSELEGSIQIFKDEIKNAEGRRDAALNEIEEFVAAEETRLNAAIELLNSQLDTELKDISDRKNATINSGNGFNEKSKGRRELVHDQNENYKLARIKLQKDNVHRLEYAFEGKRDQFDNEYNETLELLKNNRDFKIDEANQKLQEVKNQIKAIEDDASSKIEATKEERRNKENELAENNVKNTGRLDVNDRNHRTSINNAMYEKNTALDQSNQQIEEDIKAMKAKVEQDTKTQAKNYDMTLNKELDGVDARLKQELQTVL